MVQNEPQYVSRLEAKINLELGRKVVEKIMVLPQVSKAIVLCGMSLCITCAMAIGVLNGDRY
jgi:hypothetical protein